MRNHLRHIIIGMTDGIIIPFSLTAALSTRVDQSATVALAGMLTALAGSLTMASGGYLNARKQGSEFRPFPTAAGIGLGYLSGGLFMILPYLIWSDLPTGLILSTTAAIPMLFLSGWIEADLHAENRWKGGLRALGTGLAAAAAAIFVASLF